MLARQEYSTPSNAFPRDVTSPGPDQRRGVVRSRQASTCPSDKDRLPVPAVRKMAKSLNRISRPNDWLGLSVAARVNPG